MTLDHQLFVDVKQFRFCTQAAIATDTSSDGKRVLRRIVGYHSDRWAVPGGGEWNSEQLREFAEANGYNVEHRL